MRSISMMLVIGITVERGKRLIDLEKYIEYFNRHDMFSITKGMKLVELRENYSKVEMTIDENSMNYMGTMHGGLLYTMADVAAGTAIVCGGKQGVTLSAYTDYIKAALKGKVIAEGWVNAVGNKICRCDVSVHAEDGTVYSKSSITMFITNNDVIIPDENLR